MLSLKSLGYLAVVAVAILSLGGQSSGQSISCSSDDGNRHYCATNGPGQVQLVKQRSDSPCQQGYSWGSDNRGIWVDRGCRADFAVLPYAYGGQDQSNTISCSSDDGNRHYCPMNGPGQVQLVKQRSDSPCQQGYSWGSDNQGIWVDRGCRADFAVVPYSYGGQDQSNTISCSSDDGNRHYCPTNGPGQVQLVKQRSDSPCQQGYSWGSDNQGIWVDRGCRADFAVVPYSYGGQDQSNTISCSSDDGNRHYCPTNGPGQVQLVKQRSDSPCQQGYSWGSDNQRIWVDRGCRADFAVVLYAYGAQDQSNTISCSSDDGNRHYCPTNGPGQVQLVKQRSDSPCQQGSTWGSDNRGIWVDRGCRADFAVVPYAYGGQDQGSTISCSSDDGHKHYCPADTRGGVRLLKQRSESVCEQGRSWGFDRHRIWVDHGCRADFLVGR